VISHSNSPKAHSNTIRAIIKHLDKVPEGRVPDLKVPSAVPLVYSFRAPDPADMRCDHAQLVVQGRAANNGMCGKFLLTPNLWKLTPGKSVKYLRGLEPDALCEQPPVEHFSSHAETVKHERICDILSATGPACAWLKVEHSSP
jgi:hypothetical protein